jgi:GNAT superfamily N-acetyltransferase
LEPGIAGRRRRRRAPSRSAPRRLLRGSLAGASDPRRPGDARRLRLRGRLLGLARSLVETIGAHAAAHGATRLFLEVAEDNAAARALYAAGGFVTVGRRRGYYARRLGPAVDALTMRRDLPPDGASWLAKP